MNPTPGLWTLATIFLLAAWGLWMLLDWIFGADCRAQRTAAVECDAETVDERPAVWEHMHGTAWVIADDGSCATRTFVFRQALPLDAPKPAEVPSEGDVHPMVSWLFACRPEKIIEPIRSLSGDICSYVVSGATVTYRPRLTIDIDRGWRRASVLRNCVAIRSGAAA